MAKTTEEIRLVVKSELDKLVKDLKKTNNEIAESTKRNKGLTSSLANVKVGYLALASGLVAVTAAYAKTVTAASDAEEVTSKFNTVFKGVTKDMDASVRLLTDSYAMSTTEAKKHLSSVQDLLVPMGMASDSAALMSEEVVRLAADLGSFNKMPTAQVMADIQSGLIGNFETMQKHGVVMNETVIRQKALNLGLDIGKGVIDANTKAQVAFKLMLEGSAAAIGDMDRKQNSYANTVKRLNAYFDDFMVEIGKELLPVLTDLMNQIIDTTKSSEWFLNAIVSTTKGIAQMISYAISLVEWIGKIGDFFERHSGKIKILHAASAGLWGDVIKNYKNYLDHDKEIAKQQDARAAKVKEVANIEKASIADLNNFRVEASEKQKKTMENVHNSHKATLDEYRQYIYEQKELEELEETERRDRLLEAFGEDLEKREAIKRKYEENVAAMEAEFFKQKFDATLVHTQNVLGVMSQMSSQLTNLFNQRMQNEQIALENNYKHATDILDKQYQDEKKRIEQSNRDQETKDKLLRELDEKYAKDKTALDSHMESEKRRIARDGAAAAKKFAVFETIVNTLAGAIAAYKSLAAIPIVGPALGAAAAAAITTVGVKTAQAIKAQPLPAAFEGAFIKGSAQGTPVLAGEKGKSEAIIPFENEEAMEKLSGFGTTQYVFNIDNLYATEDIPSEVAIAIDRALLKLHQNKNSAFAEAVV